MLKRTTLSNFLSSLRRREIIIIIIDDFQMLVMGPEEQPHKGAVSSSSSCCCCSCCCWQSVVVDHVAQRAIVVRPCRMQPSSLLNLLHSTEDLIVNIGIRERGNKIPFVNPPTYNPPTYYPPTYYPPPPGGAARHKHLLPPPPAPKAPSFLGGFEGFLCGNPISHLLPPLPTTPPGRDNGPDCYYPRGVVGRGV